MVKHDTHPQCAERKKEENEGEMHEMTPFIGNPRDRAESMPPFGLVNTSAICWFNSLIQALISSDRFVCAMYDEMKASEEYSVVLTSFHAFLAEPKRSGAVYSAQGVLSAMVATLKPGSFVRQEDAQEGFYVLLDRLPTAIAKLFESEYKIYRYCDRCEGMVSRSDEKNVQIFMERAIIPICVDGNPFIEFISGNLSETEGYNCPKCAKADKDDSTMSTTSGKGARPAKTVSVARLVDPAQVMVISFKKFIGKWDAPAVPEEIEIPYGLARNKSARYRLMAVIRQNGDLGGGHYKAICRRGGRIWVLNDAEVSPGDFQSAQDDYMMVWERIDRP